MRLLRILLHEDSEDATSPELPKVLNSEICRKAHRDSDHGLGYIPPLRTFGSSGKPFQRSHASLVRMQPELVSSR